MNFGTGRPQPSELIEQLGSPEPDVRCRAANHLTDIDPEQGVELILPLLDDECAAVRWYVCGILGDMGDLRAVGPLAKSLQFDSDPQVRGTAAYALGCLGDTTVILPLIKTSETDHEADQLGYTPSSLARDAISKIMEQQPKSIARLG
jgi:HEAT repeat protein